MNLKALTKVCAKGDNRRILQYINVRHVNDCVLYEATNGYMAVQIIVHKVDDCLASGQYTQEDWKDLVCKGRPAVPMQNPGSYPDLDTVMPCAPDDPQRETDKGVREIGFDLEYFAILRSIVGDIACELRFRGENGDPVRIDAYNSALDMRLVALIMPYRIKKQIKEGVK